MRPLRLLSLLAVPFLCQAQLDVFYTGRTLGYFRSPDTQAATADPCDPSPAKMNAAGSKLFEAARLHRDTPSLLVGMGDNFGPDLSARAFTFPTAPQFRGKDRYTFDTTTKQWVENSTSNNVQIPAALIPNDNVGCFLRAMQYDALTPGKHDFYSGPDHLRLMARFLYEGYPADFSKPGPAFLAANLSISTTAPDAKARLPLYQIEHDLRERMPTPAGTRPLYTFVAPVPLPLPIALSSKRQVANHGDDPAPSITFPDAVLPSLRRFSIDNAYFLSYVDEDHVPHRFVPADSTFKQLLSPDKLPAATDPPFRLPGLMLPAPSRMYLVGTREDPRAKEVKIVPRIDGLTICHDTTTDDIVRNPYRFAAPGQEGCKPVPVAADVSATDFKTGTIVFEANEEILKPDHNYAACMHLVEGQFQGVPTPQYYCVPFYVAEPFFSYARAVPGTTPDTPARPSSGKDKEPRPDDPFVVKVINGEKAAIFGLLDPDLQGKIGRLNYGWLNKKSRYETTAQITGLADALKQAMLRCSLVELCSTSTRKVLLAQMPAAKAAQFVATLDPKKLPWFDPLFDLVVAETDSANATPDGDASRTLPQGTSPRFVVVPDELYQPEKLSIQLGRAVVGRASTPVPASPTPPPLRWHITNSHTPDGVTEPLAGPASGTCGDSNHNTLRCAAIETLRKMGSKAPPGVLEGTLGTGQILQNLALLVMQRQLHTDISLLQTRDIFRPELYGPAAVDGDNLQEMLDRVFWKGDFVFPIPVSGATLAAILQASTDFGTLEANPTTIDIEKGRSFLTLGAFKDAADKNWNVNGAIVDPGKMYSIAMTDFVALGDTGYPQLKIPVVPYPYRIKDFSKLDSISALVCRAIRREAMSNAVCFEDVLSAPKYLDISGQRPPDITPGLTTARQARAYLSIPIRWSRFNMYYRAQNSSEELSSQKRFWSLDVEKGDFGFNLNLHKKFAATDPANPPLQTGSLMQQFGGITVAPVTAANSYMYTFDSRIRLKYSTYKLDYFLLNESAFAFTRTQDAKDNRYTRSLSQNSLSFESGSLLHIWPRYRQPAQVDFLASARVETQPFSSREDPSVALGSLSGTLRRSLDLFGKIGFRASDDRSWLEIGYLTGISLRNPAQIVFQDAARDTVNFFPGCNTCQSTMPTLELLKKIPGPIPFLDMLNYLFSTKAITPTVAAVPATATAAAIAATTATPFTALYVHRPVSGIFFNFSQNIPLPFLDRYQDWAGGKPIALLAENQGKLYFNQTDDRPTQTRYYDKLMLSIVFPLVGNLSFKPEVDLVYYRNKVEDHPFRGVNYTGTLSYTFAWREGQPWRRVWRYASPVPTTSVPSSGR